MNTLNDPQAGFEAWWKSRLDKYEAELDAAGLEDWKLTQPPELQAKIGDEIENRKQVRMDARKAALKAEWLKLISTLSEIPESACRDALGGSTTKVCDRYSGCRQNGICQGAAW